MPVRASPHRIGIITFLRVSLRALTEREKQPLLKMKRNFKIFVRVTVILISIVVIVIVVATLYMR